MRARQAACPFSEAKRKNRPYRLPSFAEVDFGFAKFPIFEGERHFSELAAESLEPPEQLFKIGIPLALDRLRR